MSQTLTQLSSCNMTGNNGKCDDVLKVQPAQKEITHAGGALTYEITLHSVAQVHCSQTV